MKNTLFCSIIVFFVSVVSCAEENKTNQEQWKFDMQLTANILQSSYSNWQMSSGTGSFSWSLGLLSCLKVDTEYNSWISKLKTEYGQIKEEGEIAKKALDRLDFESFLNFKTEARFEPFLRFNFKTQYNYFLDPAILIEGIGVGKDILPSLNIKIGIAAREIFVNTQTRFTENYSTDEIEKFKFQIGISSIIEHENKIMPNMLLISRFEAFSPHLLSFENIKIYIDNDLIMRINDLMNVKLTLLIAYDEDWSKDFQMYENLSLGFVFNIF